MSQRFLTTEEAAEYALLLSSYHPSGQVVYDFAKSKFATIDGPTGAGKDTLRTELIKRHPELYRPVLSTTTRPLRPGEADGVEYHFRDLNFIDQGLDERRFLQAEMIHNQQISGLDFGDIANLDSNHFGLGILNVYTVKKLRLLNATMNTMFIIAPSYTELRRRMELSRSMKEDEINRRLTAAISEIQTALADEKYYLVTNTDLNHTVELAHAYFQNGDRDASEQDRTKTTMSEILNELSINLGTKQ